MARKQDKNLEKGKATQFKSGDNAASNGRKGGIASGEAKRAKKTMAQLAQVMVTSELDEQGKQTLRKLCGAIADEDSTVGALMLAGQVKSAIKGNTKAFSAVNELIDRATVSTEEKLYELPARVLGKAFVDINRQIEPNKTYVFKGGRGGTKSSYISLKLIELIKNNPQMHGCVVRKVGNTLRDSVYAQMKWAINELGLAEEFDYKVNPLEITYKKTGQKIFFRGADDPLKLKSIKPEFGYIGILWIEERDQIAGAAEERSIKQSVLRGGMLSYDFGSYNPPKSKSNWVNKELELPDPNRIVHHSTYLEAPLEWLGQKFMDDAERLKMVNPEAYEHEYMGVPNGDGGNVFDNIETREITDEEIKSFDHIYQGADWGLSPDPFAFVRLHYDVDTETVYFIDEIYRRHTFNDEAAQLIIDMDYDDFEICCDSSEKKSVNDFKDMGLAARAAIKGAGSVEYGMKWLMHRKLVIDPQRTPNIHKEFTEYEYDRDKEGNVISGYPDRDNHTIDATRYALERYCNRRGTSA